MSHFRVLGTVAAQNGKKKDHLWKHKSASYQAKTSMNERVEST
jgi:hypothetical protein